MKIENEKSELQPGAVINVPVTDEEWICMPIKEWEKTLRGNIALRDFFAGCALIGRLSSKERIAEKDCVVAAIAYQYADAMLRERGDGE